MAQPKAMPIIETLRTTLLIAESIIVMKGNPRLPKGVV
jgi:hypothetical protein